MPAYYVGLISGTSVDGIDAVLADLSATRPELLAAQTIPWEPPLHEQLLSTLNRPQQVSLTALGELDAALGDAFATAALTVIAAAGLHPADVTAIGSHGQTLFHAPSAQPPFTLQAGDPSRIAARTGVTTVADFRRRDMAEGGQGAPMVPALHQALFSHVEIPRAILNIGGIANLTILPPNGGKASGFDTGPGNGLMDAWTTRHRQQAFDRNGDWARSGAPDAQLLAHLLQQPYLQLPPPKSTGRELFNLPWLLARLDEGFSALPAATVQATLAEFTAVSIADALQRAGTMEELYVCGGGVHNGHLMERLQAQLPQCRIATTAALGLAPDWVEATAFAWLAMRTLAGEPGNLPSVTGARRAAVLGAIYPA